MEGGLAPVVEGVQGDAILEQDVDHHVLTVVAGNVERGAAIGVDGIRLKGWNMYIYMYACMYMVYVHVCMRNKVHIHVLLLVLTARFVEITYTHTIYLQ